MSNLASETTIDKLAFARDVLEAQIDARIAARDAQILEADSFFKALKTRLLAKCIGGLGFRIIDCKNKDKPSPEVGVAKLKFSIKDWAIPIFKSLTKKENRDIVVDLVGNSSAEQVFARHADWCGRTLGLLALRLRNECQCFGKS